MPDIIQRNAECARQLLECAAEIADLRSRLDRIWQIAHVPTPQGTRAYTHFQRDFDEIRALAQIAKD